MNKVVPFAKDPDKYFLSIKIFFSCVTSVPVIPFFKILSPKLSFSPTAVVEVVFLVEVDDVPFVVDELLLPVDLLLDDFALDVPVDEPVEGEE